MPEKFKIKGRKIGGHGGLCHVMYCRGIEKYSNLTKTCLLKMA